MARLFGCLLSEIFPAKIRGKAMSLATFSLWIGTALVGQLTPVFLEKLKPAGTFWLFAAHDCSGTLSCH